MAAFNPTQLEGAAPGLLGLDSFATQTETLGYTIVNEFALRDTKSHTYRTDPNYIAWVPIAFTIPTWLAYKIAIKSSLNQAITVQPIENDERPSGAQGSATNPPDPDWNVAPNTSIAIGAASYLGSVLTARAVGDGKFPFDVYPVEYLSVSISAATAPTLGKVSVVLYLYPR